MSSGQLYLVFGVSEEIQAFLSTQVPVASACAPKFAEKFDPWRWSNVEIEEDGASKVTKDGNDFAAWMPFGSGSRSCVGQRMAMVKQLPIVSHNCRWKQS
jgi:hypothetical protein